MTLKKTCAPAGCEDLVDPLELPPFDPCAATCPSVADPELLDKLMEIISILERPPVGIELGSIEVGCIPDDDGNAIGKVYMCIVRDEADTATTTELKAVLYADGSIVSPYTGPIAACTTGNCPDEAPLGVITDLSQL